MAQFLVLDVGDTQRRVALLDRLGSYHVARAAAEVPVVGAFLDGPYAFHGTCTMTAARTGEVYRLTFEAVGCGQQETLDRLHAAPRRAG